MSIATAATTVIAADITDVTVSTGPQLKKRLDEASAQENVGAAMRFFADRKLEPDTRNLSDIRFRADGETYDMFFCTIWRTDADSSRGRLKSLVLSAQGPKGSRVILGTISTETKPPTVKEEHAVLDGKILPSEDHLKKILSCSFIGCVGAAPCFLTPGSIPCFCLGCGGVAIACALNEALFP